MLEKYRRPKTYNNQEIKINRQDFKAITIMYLPKIFANKNLFKTLIFF